MTLTLKPAGRGNWHETVMQISTRAMGSILVRPGQTFTLGGIVWRICKVEP